MMNRAPDAYVDEAAFKNRFGWTPQRKASNQSRHLELHSEVLVFTHST